MVSTIVTVLDTDELFPHSSVADHVIDCISVHPSSDVEEIAVSVTVPQLSVQTGIYAGIASSHSTVTSTGGLVITGAVVSTTVIVCVSSAVFPHPSSAT